MKGINEFTCITRKATLASRIHGILSLTCCPTLGILSLLPNTNEKETYENGTGQRAIPLYWMDFAHTQTPQRHTVHICGPSSGGWSQRSLLCSLVKSGADERRASKRKTGFAQKIKPPERWQWEQFTAVRLPLKVLANARDNPRIYLPTFSITKVAQQCNGYATMWAYERRCAHEK